MQVSTIDLEGLVPDSYAEYGSSYDQPYNYSPLDFDPKKPDDKKNLVKLIEDKEKEIKNFLHNVKENDKKLLEYDKQQKKYLLDYTMKQKKYLLDFEKQQKKHHLDLKKDKKKDKLHKPKDPKYENYESYLYPQKVYPIPLPPHLPNYGIQTDPPQQNNGPQIPYNNGNYPFDKNDYPNDQLLPSYSLDIKNPLDINYPAPSLDDLNAQYTDPFHSWTSPNYLPDGRNAEESDLEREVCMPF